jgi:hypothetical protein
VVPIALEPFLSKTVVPLTRFQLGWVLNERKYIFCFNAYVSFVA